ncbi:MAG: hypothetical protein EOP84_31340, partial [Verrucomicrobiaceae bacterium]
MLASVVISLLLTQFGGGEDIRKQFAAGPKDAVMMFPPETVCGSQSLRLIWSGDGSNLLVHRIAVDLTPADMLAMTASPRPTPQMMARLSPRSELIAWSVKTRKAKTIVSLKGQSAAITDIEPLAGSDAFYVQCYETIKGDTGNPPAPVAAMYIVSAGDGSVRRLNAAVDSSGTFDQVFISPKRPLGAIKTFDSVNK